MKSESMQYRKNAPVTVTIGLPFFPFELIIEETIYENQVTEMLCCHCITHIDLFTQLITYAL